MRYQILNTWNGGKGYTKVEFTSKAEGVEGHNECFKWILDHTSFSFFEATTNQGYSVEVKQVLDDPARVSTNLREG